MPDAFSGLDYSSAFGDPFSMLTRALQMVQIPPQLQQMVQQPFQQNPMLGGAAQLGQSLSQAPPRGPLPTGEAAFRYPEMPASGAQQRFGVPELQGPSLKNQIGELQTPFNPLTPPPGPTPRPPTTSTNPYDQFGGGTKGGSDPYQSISDLLNNLQFNINFNPTMSQIMYGSGQGQQGGNLDLPAPLPGRQSGGQIDMPTMIPGPTGGGGQLPIPKGGSNLEDMPTFGGGGQQVPPPLPMPYGGGSNLERMPTFGGGGQQVPQLPMPIGGGGGSNLERMPTFGGGYQQPNQQFGGMGDQFRANDPGSMLGQPGGGSFPWGGPYSFGPTFTDQQGRQQLTRVGPGGETENMGSYYDPNRNMYLPVPGTGGGTNPGSNLERMPTFGEQPPSSSGSKVGAFQPLPSGGGMQVKVGDPGYNPYNDPSVAGGKIWAGGTPPDVYDETKGGQSGQPGQTGGGYSTPEEAMAANQRNRAAGGSNLEKMPTFGGGAQGAIAGGVGGAAGGPPLVAPSPPTLRAPGVPTSPGAPGGRSGWSPRQPAPNPGGGGTAMLDPSLGNRRMQMQQWLERQRLLGGRPTPYPPPPGLRPGVPLPGGMPGGQPPLPPMPLPPPPTGGGAYSHGAYSPPYMSPAPSGMKQGAMDTMKQYIQNQSLYPAMGLV